MTVDDIFSIYARSGSSLYFGEPVTVAEHGLQTAYFAQTAGAADALVVAALLHDIGHLIDAAPDNIEEWDSDQHHEITGSRWLASYFGPDVYGPVRLHVPAKRYLCATNSSYVARLSAASVQTLKLQGGSMSPEEISQFEVQPHRHDALLLRQCDDQGKVQGLRTPGFDHYREIVRACLSG